MINCNQNDNDNKKHHINNHINRPRRRHQQTTCLGKITSIYNQQHFQAQFIKKLSNTEAELKKMLAYKKTCIWYAHAQFSEKLLFLPPDTYTEV